MKLTANSTVEDVAATVSQALIDAGIVATLSGGAAVSIYSHNAYQSQDLDFVTAAVLTDIRPVMEGLGFLHTGTGHLSEFKHPEIAWFVEFVSAPLAFGDYVVNPDDCAAIKFKNDVLRIITPTQSVMDRLAAAFHWNDPQSREQALQIARHQKINWEELEACFMSEGQDAEVFANFNAAAVRGRES